MFEEIFKVVTEFVIENWLPIVAPFITGIVTSFVVQAIRNLIKKKNDGEALHAWWFVGAISFVIGLWLAFMMKDFYSSLSIFAFGVLVNTSVAILWYEKKGKKSVDEILDATENKVNKKL